MLVVVVVVVDVVLFVAAEVIVVFGKKTARRDLYEHWLVAMKVFIAHMNLARHVLLALAL